MCYICFTNKDAARRENKEKGKHEKKNVRNVYATKRNPIWSGRCPSIQHKIPVHAFAPAKHFRSEIKQCTGILEYNKNVKV